ncbi:alpha/beta-hydrolase [Testicularia cyperi]|uniref:Carboxylic ester hydrolase n=1 Tax=Testicularia cyperi TaxID=1882483 RepID=A0A317XIC7_9BASI|nr:alpha/beta-hydrolase [Testicularia cyperi]
MYSFTSILSLVCAIASFSSFCLSLPVSCQASSSATSCAADTSGSNSSLTSSTPSLSALEVDLSLGTVRGVNTSYGSQRFTLPYAQAPVGELRFASPQPLSAFPSQSASLSLSSSSVSDIYNATQLPPACMQYGDDTYGISSDKVSEDCLYLNVYRPASSSQATSSKPVLVWIHGGSFIAGSSTAPGLDASYYVAKHNVVVVTLQYRLGMFGFFSPSGSKGMGLDGNQGLRDVVAALEFIQNNIGEFGGDPNSVTVAGQSSGAHMVRALLSTPSASSLFQRAIMHSDPANYGTQSSATSEQVSDYALEQTNCQSLECLRALDANTLVDAGYATVSAASNIGPSVSAAETWRPTKDDFTGTCFESDPATSLAASSGKSIIVTNVANEGGSVIGSMLQPTTMSDAATLRAYPVTLTRSQLLSQMFNGNRSDTIGSSEEYAMATTDAEDSSTAESDGLRSNLEMILTQGQFSCAAWYNARRYANGGQVYLGSFAAGIEYPSNKDNDYCETAGRTCHEDDILLLFSDPTLNSLGLTSSQKTLLNEVQARWAQFVRTGSPNTRTLDGWSPVTSDSTRINVLSLGSASGGGSSLQTVSLTSGDHAGCGMVWTSRVQFDWQMYG